jgi:hypothetical protein
MKASASLIAKSTVESISASVSHVMKNVPWFYRAKKMKQGFLLLLLMTTAKVLYQI